MKNHYGLYLLSCTLFIIIHMLHTRHTNTCMATNTGTQYNKSVRDGKWNCYIKYHNMYSNMHGHNEENRKIK